MLDCSECWVQSSSIIILPTTQPASQTILYIATEEKKNNFLVSFVFNKCLLHVYNVPGTIVETKDKMINKIGCFSLIVA